MKVLIIGGVAGGATTAARLRRLDERAEIILVERGSDISYANCGLPYYIGGVIAERDRLFVQTPQAFRKRFNVDVRVRTEAQKIDRERKCVLLKDLHSGNSYEESYDRLLLSPGAEPLRPPVPGVDSPGIFTLRDVGDVDRIKTFVDQQKPRQAVVVGAGFIGLEMAENLHRNGVAVTIVEMAGQVMTPLDYEMAAQVHRHLKSKGIEFFLNEAVVRFTPNQGCIGLGLKSGRQLSADMILLSVGIRPDSRLAKESGLNVGARGGIEVNQFLQTSDPSIYAVGDAIEFPSPITGKKGGVYLAGPANKQGRIAAWNMVHGNQQTYAGAIGTAVAKVFDLTVASTGVSEKTLKAEGIAFESWIIHASSHAGYYPNAQALTLKILFDPKSGKILGAQAVGHDGVDKRIDTIAGVLRSNGTVHDLAEIEHAYAPPYSSAKDPVNLAGFAAENILNKTMRPIRWNEIRPDDPGAFLLDVRTPEEFRLGTIDGARNIPLDDLRTRLAEIPRDKRIIVFCGVGLRAYVAARILMQNGFSGVYNLSGGIKTYEVVTQKQESEAAHEREMIGKDDMIYQASPKPNPEDRVAQQFELNACGLQCPGPVLKLKEAVEKASAGDRIRIVATDPGFTRDVESWCKLAGHTLLSLHENAGQVEAIIQTKQTAQGVKVVETGDSKTIVFFSQDLDRALAAFVIANGAASAGKKVSMFFTFWGLNAIKKRKKPSVSKDLMGRMFGWMLPGSSLGLKLSKLNMLGMGTLMMRFRMKSLRIDSLESMIETAVRNGVKMIGCQMSMDVMGVKKEELLDNVEIGGVATYLQLAESANLNLFI